MERLSKGDRELYAQVYAYYLPKLYHFALPFTKSSKEDAEEIVHDVFLKVWMRKEALVGVRSLEAYLFSIARNLLANRHRRQQHLQQIVTQLTVVKSEEENTLQDDIIFGEYYKTALEAIEQLPEKKKRIFLLRTQQGLKLEEIATEVQLSVPGVKKHLYDAFGFIKEYMRQHGDWPALLLLLLLQG
ncbi:RNA polymerase sigma factor [Paraflavisolibacter sp. H34]|uniref:RNA polymerase sigma factor n=1 Tax=Huijunlia imazamoxiresistens TaxID=3127457 RepID=UPI00301799F5